MKPEIAYLVVNPFESEDFYSESEKPSYSSRYKKVKRIVYWEIGNED